MTERIIDFLDALVATVNDVESRYCLVEKREKQVGETVTNIPYEYVGNGNFRPVEIDGGSVSYFRLVNNISFSVVDGNTAIKDLQGTYPIRYVAIIKRDEVNPLTKSQDVANILEGRNKDLQTQLQARNVQITVDSIDTDSVRIWREEFELPYGSDDFKRSMIMIDLTVTVIAKRECWQDCDDYPDILQGFAWCEDTAATVARLTEAQKTCISNEICGTSDPANVRNSDSSYSTTVASGATLILPNIIFTDSDGSTSSVPSVQNITATACTSPSISIGVYSDAGYSIPITEASFGDTIYIRATATGITPINYVFFAIDSNDVLYEIGEGASQDTSWQITSTEDVRLFALATEDITGDIDYTGVSTAFTVNLDADAAAFITAHETATGATMAQTQKDAVIGFVARLKGVGTTFGSDLFTKLSNAGSRLFPFIPTSDSVASAAGYAINIINPAQTGSFVNLLPSDITPSGVTGGATKYFDQGVAPSAFTSTDIGADAYSRTDAENLFLSFGSSSGTNQNSSNVSLFPRYTGLGGLARVNQSSSFVLVAVANSLGLLSVDRSGTTQSHSRNGVQVATNTSTAQTPSTLNMYGLGGNGTAGLWGADTARQYSLFATRCTLNTNEMSDYYEAIQWLQTNVITGGRNV